MKTKIVFLSLMSFVFASQMEAQNRNKVTAMNNEISDNLDLRAVADIFGDSQNLQEFERRLNDPKIQISNLDLNNDNEVDYLRVIETVEGRTHVIIVQSVLDRDVYQDVATIDVEKDNNNRVQIQIVGNEFMYGPNYIYEPVYYSTPLLYASFWSYNYRPYVSNWYWNFYPLYYYAWNPYPTFRYRNNIQINLNVNNRYNYVNYRRSNQAVVLYNSRRANGYERQHPDYAFSRRYTTVSNRYELDRRRETRNNYSRNEIGYYQTRNKTSNDNTRRSTEANRNYSQNRTATSRQNTSEKTENQRNYSQNRTETSRQTAPQRTENQRNYGQNRTESSRQTAPQRTESQRTYTSNRGESSGQSAPQRNESQRNYAQNRAETSRQSAPQSNSNTQRQSAPQRNTEQNNSSSRGQNRR